MIAIYAEKPDMAKKIAAALDCITIGNGYKVQFNELEKYSKQVTACGMSKGYYKIKFKGEDCLVTWGIGHLVTLKQAVDYNKDYKNWRKLPIPFFPDKWELKVIPNTKEQYEKAKEVLKKADYIINSTDDDREGELLFAYAYEKMGIKTPYKYRVKFSIQTKEGIRDAFDNLIDAKLCKNTEYAGRGRSIADAAIGWNCTAQQTISVNSKDVISVGRCQIATLNMIVKKELEIKNFKPEDYFVLEAKFTKNNIDFKGEHMRGKFKTKKEAENLLDKIKGYDGIVTNIDKKDISKEVPGLYNSDLIQMDANSKYGFTLDKTLDILESLYMKGYTTYPRTDSSYLNEGTEDMVNNVLDSLARDNSEYQNLINGQPRKFAKSKKYFDNSKITSHFAIIPTTVNPVNMTSDEEKVYDLIARSVIRMVYDNAVIEKTNVILNVNGEDFKSSGNSIKEMGWFTVDGVPKESLLPTLVLNDNVNGTYSVITKKTEPPKRYTDKTLLVAMSNAGKEIPDTDLRKFMASHKIEGIGRPSTRASIVEKLVTSEYIRRDKRSIVATDKGIETINIIPFDEIKSAELTAKWEKKLSDIEDGKLSLDVFIKEIKDLTIDWCTKIRGNAANQSSSLAQSSQNSNTGYKCKLCGAVVNEYQWGYGCSNYKNGCKFSVGKVAYDKKLTKTELNELLTLGETKKPVKGLIYNGNKFESILCIKDTGKVGCKKIGKE